MRTSTLLDPQDAAPAGDHRRRAQVHQDRARIWSTNAAIRQAERELAAHAEASYKRLVTDQRAGAPARKLGASATPERA